MILDQFKTHPEFPFDRYFESSNHYAGAMQYWMAVLRAADTFVDTDWHPRSRPVEIDEDMYLGKVIDIVSMKLRKEINLQIWSVPGDANTLLTENSGVTETEYAALKESLGPEFELSQEATRGMSAAEAMAEAREEASRNASKIWVEDCVIWQPDPKSDEGGYEIRAERLVMTAQVTPDGEAAVLRALALFLVPGTARAQINALFAET